MALMGTKEIVDAAMREADKHNQDSCIVELGTITTCPKKTKCCLIFKAADLSLLMSKAVDASMVKYQTYSAGGLYQSSLKRNYPRSGQPVIFPGAEKESSELSAGGREKFTGDVYQKLGTFTSVFHENIRLADFLILHKRKFVKEAVFEGGHLKTKTMTQEEYRDFCGGVIILPYPLICVYSHKSPPNGLFRLLQAIFMVRLNKRLVQHPERFEVVAREGFGSAFPTMSDLGNGMRLDPGLLPLDRVADVKYALKELDSLYPKICKYATDDLLSKVGDKDGLEIIDALVFELMECPDEKFDTVVTSDLSQLFAKLPGRRKAAPAAPGMYNVVTAPISSQQKGKKEKTGDKPAGVDKATHICVELPFIIAKEKKFTEAEATLESEYGGLGSDSEDELPSRTEKDSAFIIKKVSFISGMAAINFTHAAIPTYLKGALIECGGGVQQKELGVATYTYRYFEIAHTSAVGFSHINPAPNPGNAIGTSNDKFPGIGKAAVTTMDVTNCTTLDKAGYIDKFIQGFSSETPWRLLILQESASKQAVGGDLVYGVARVVGMRSSVDSYIKVLSDADQRAALGKDHVIRRRMQENYLVSRNRDISYLYQFLLKDELPK
ncbi:hypothetical protein ACIOZM_01170 [Pseudomonas sp. NPDC087346]|uniref:hypothetical protein n=1 Tax=Pseudomonas sp. NPDC087346 TaxID=3364438 RepID=UPI003819D98B